MEKEEPREVEVSEIRTIQVLASVVPLHKAMGFRVDSQINSLAAHAKALIEYSIGEELTPIEESISKLSAEIAKPFQEQYEIDSSGLSDEEKKALYGAIDQKMNRAIGENEDVMDLKIKESALWKKKIPLDLKTILIDDKEYDEKFKEAKPVNVNGRQILLDGYQCLLDLITIGVIKIKE